MKQEDLNEYLVDVDRLIRAISKKYDFNLHYVPDPVLLAAVMNAVSLQRIEDQMKLSRDMISEIRCAILQR